MGYYRTAKFKLRTPSGRKVRRLRSAIESGSEAYKNVMDEAREKQDELPESVQTKTGKTSSYQLTKWLKGLNATDVKGAIRDGVLEEANQSLLSWMALDEGDDQEAGFPSPTTKEEAQQTIEDCISGSEYGLEWEDAFKAAVKSKAKGYTRPLSFCRFRDAPLLRSPDGEKMWIALPIYTEKGQTSIPPCESVREDQPFETSKTSKFVLSRLELSRWHMHRFFGEGVPKSCRVTEEDGEFFVHYAFEFEAPDKRDVGTVLGVDRGEVLTSAFVVTDENGGIIEEGTSAGEDLRARLSTLEDEIAHDQEAGREPDWPKWNRVVKSSLHQIANQIVRTADKYNALICFENLSNMMRRSGKGLRKRQYRRVHEYVLYKAEAKGLKVIEVHPAYTSLTCPECGHQSKENRETQADFACTDCGYTKNADVNASRNIAIRGQWYLDGGKKKTGANSFQKYVRMLAKERHDNNSWALNGKSETSQNTCETIPKTGDLFAGLNAT